MKKTENYFIALIKKIYLSSSMTFYYSYFPIPSYSYLETILDKEINNKKEIIDRINNINYESLKSYIEEPQINDLIHYYVDYILIKNITEQSVKTEAIKDNIFIYLIKVIENYYQDISDDDSITNIKQCISIIFEIAETISNIQKVNLFFEEVNLENRTKKLINKIEYILESEFIIENAEYKKAKNKYVSSLKEFYRNDHIYLIDEFKFNKFYVPPKLLKGHKKMDSVFGENYKNNNFFQQSEVWKHIFDENNIVYIIGGAGYGKSLFMKNIINNTNDIFISGINDYLMVYCDLKAYYNGDQGDSKTIIDFFVESIVNNLGVDYITKDIIIHYLKLGRCLLLLDALDEVPKEKRNILHRKIINYIESNYRNNKVCITSRDRGFIPQKDIEVFKIKPLDETDISIYIDNMISLKVFKSSNKDAFMEQARALIKKRFLNNFLVLSLLVSIFKAEKKLPENKVDLYNKCFLYIAKQREKQKSSSAYNKNVEYLMKESTFISLSELSAPNNRDIEKEKIEECLVNLYKNKFSNIAETEQVVEQFLEFCSERTEIFVPAPSDDKFKFFHRSFFEYFYAKFILRQSDVSEIFRLMQQFDVDSEVFELVTAVLKEENEEKYQELIEYIFEQTVSELTSESSAIYNFEILTLCMQVVDDIVFKRDYYKIIIEYSNVLSSSDVRLSNNRLICNVIGETILNDENKRRDFLVAYENACVYQIIMNSKIFNFEEYYDKMDDEQAKSFSIELFKSIIFHSPFYVIEFYRLNEIVTLLNEKMKKNSNYLWKEIAPNKWDRNAKKAFSEGYNNCKKILEHQE